MYLNRIKIKKFRSINELEVQFNKGINIIIGENNAGKSTIIDALRICLNIGREWRDIGVRNDEDFYIDPADINSDHQPIEFDLYFTIETDEDRDLFTSMVWQDPADVTKQDIQLHFRYVMEVSANGGKNMRMRSWGGGMEGQRIDTYEAQLLYYTYLAPLRNAEQELRPYAKDNKISSLFRDLTSYQALDNGNVVLKRLDGDAKTALAAKLEQVIQDDDWTGLIQTGTKFVNEHLEKADIRNKENRVHLRILEYKYENIVKGIMTRKPVFPLALLQGGNEHKQRYFDVSQNGLGENNLIFASAVLGDLKNRRSEGKEHYYSLLIEEPEAHLHPQRQTTFFNYLNNLQDLGLQIFITSHSPTLTAKSDLDNLIVIQHSRLAQPFTVKNSELSIENKAFLRKFLDVTKSQLFFSNGTILVEGISELLLLPVFANNMGAGFNLDENGIEVVNIGGVSFEAFGKLYNSVDAAKRLSTKCSILTDDDRGILKAADFNNDARGVSKAVAKSIFSKLQNLNVVDSSNRIVSVAGAPLALDDLEVHLAFVNEVLDAKRAQISGRATNAINLQAGNLQSHVAVYTFEYELMIAAELNYRIMMHVYKKMHPRTEFLERTVTLERRALEFVAKLDANKDKSAFAEALAQAISTWKHKERFVVPIYIQNAIRWVIPA